MDGPGGGTDQRGPLPERKLVHPAPTVAGGTDELERLTRRLMDDPRHLVVMCGPRDITLRAPFTELAAELFRQHGDALEIVVGHKRFPAERIGALEAVEVPVATISVPGLELTIEMDEQTVAPGEDARGRGRFSNRGLTRVEGTSGILTGGVRAERHDVMAGAFGGAVPAKGQVIALDPGASSTLALRVGTASCLPDRSYVVPPGRYEVVVPVPFLGHGMDPVGSPQLVARGVWITVAAP